MTEYTNEQLKTYSHPTPNIPQHPSHPAPKVQYSKTATPVEHETTTSLSPQQQQNIQIMMGSLLYYGCAVDPTILK